MTFEEYLAQGVDAGQFRLVPIVQGTDSQVTFYIHPLGKNGATHDYLVKGNDLIRIQSALEGTARQVEEPQTITTAEAADAAAVYVLSYKDGSTFTSEACSSLEEAIAENNGKPPTSAKSRGLYTNKWIAVQIAPEAA